MFIDKVSYPFKSIIEDYPLTITESHATQLANKYYRGLVSFFCFKNNSTRESILTGSGFLVLLPGTSEVCIATASHVVTDLMQSDSRIIRIDGVNYPFAKMEVFHNSEQDYALIVIPPELLPCDITYPYFNLDYRKELTPLRSFMITGFPSKKNQFHIDREPKGLHQMNLVFHSFGFDTETHDIYFHYNAKKGKKGTQFTPEPLSTDNNIPKLSGMSGGVISQIMINPLLDSLSLRPIGIFKEHKKSKNLLVGSTFLPFACEIEKII